jgi:hypothetical protein
MRTGQSKRTPGKSFFEKTSVINNQPSLAMFNNCPNGNASG